jgi:hypothetical protein
VTALLILAAVLTPSAALVLNRLWVTRGRSPAEERAIRRAERDLARHFDAQVAADNYIREGEK